MFHILVLFFLSFNLSAEILLPEKKDNFYNDVYYFEDKTNLLSIKNIKNKKFHKNDKKFLNFGHTCSTIWLKLEIKSTENKRYILDYGQYLIDDIDVFYVHNTILMKHYSTGNKKTNDTKIIDTPTFSFPLDLYKNEKLTLFIKLNSTKVLNIPMKIEFRKEFQKKTFNNYLFSTSFFTTLFISLFFTSILYIITYKKIFIIYAGYLFANISTWFIFSGLSSNYLFYDYPKVNQCLLYISLFLFHLFFIKFSIEILKIENLKYTVKIIKFSSYFLFFIVTLLNIIFIIFELPTYQLYFSIANLYAGFFILLSILIISFSKLLKKARFSGLFTLFWIIKTLFMLLFFINIRYTFFEMQTILIVLKLSIILESLCIPMILGYRLRIYERKNDKLKKLYKEQKRLALENYMLSSNANLISIIAHQLKQPLNNFNSIALNIETRYLNKKLDKKYLNKKLHEIELQTEYMSDTINTFTNYFHPNKKKELFFLYDTLIESLSLLSAQMSKKSIQYTIKCSKKSIQTEGYKDEYIQVLLILLNNSIEAFENEKDKIIKFYIYVNKENLPIFSIKNNAKTIPEKISKKIFDQNFTTKPNNSGLGLFLAKRIIESMNKKIEHKRVPIGAKFNIIG